jgi:hypothetical protein
MEEILAAPLTAYTESLQYTTGATLQLENASEKFEHGLALLEEFDYEVVLDDASDYRFR